MVALVTGAGVGIGRAIALALLADEMDTWLADVQDPEGPEGHFVEVDVTDDAALRRLIVDVKPDVLVNSAGGIPAARSEVEILGLNLRSALVATEPALEQGAHAIVNIASVAGIESIPHPSPAYAAAKAGLIRLTTACDGPARVNCIVPGWIAPPRGLAEAAAIRTPSAQRRVRWSRWRRSPPPWATSSLTTRREAAAWCCAEQGARSLSLRGRSGTIAPPAPGVSTGGQSAVRLCAVAQPLVRLDDGGWRRSRASIWRLRPRAIRWFLGAWSAVLPMPEARVNAEDPRRCRRGSGLPSAVRALSGGRRPPWRAWSGSSP
jgi:NAD(P)-dependent dehydrogenase (short-subunit alcohol dehydrogenase family)